MTNENLIKANKLKEEIQELENFIFTADKTWTGKIIKREAKFIFKSHPYGVFDSAEYEMDTPIKNSVLDVLKEYLENLKNQLRNI